MTEENTLRADKLETMLREVALDTQDELTEAEVWERAQVERRLRAIRNKMMHKASAEDLCILADPVREYTPWVAPVVQDIDLSVPWTMPILNDLDI